MHIYIEREREITLYSMSHNMLNTGAPGDEARQ